MEKDKVQNERVQKIIRTEQKIKGLKLIDLKTIKFIASGQYSSIYEVTDEKGIVNGKKGHHYAMKEVPKQIVKENKLSTQIQNEIEIMYKQELHPNILRLFTHFEDEFNIYLVMEFVEGWNLRSLQLIQTIDFSIKTKIIKQIIVGIQCLHQNGIIHRDIKPENLLITSDSNVKISDFGWSNYFPQKNRKRFTKIASSGAQFFPFTAPEVRAKSGHSEKLDIWCLGMIIYFILSDGEYPYDIPNSFSTLSTSDIEEIELKIRQNKFNLNDSVFKKCSSTKPILEKMLNKDPSLRPTINEVFNYQFFSEEKEKEDESKEIKGESNIENKEINEKNDNVPVSSSDSEGKKQVDVIEKAQEKQKNLFRISLNDLLQATKIGSGDNPSNQQESQKKALDVRSTIKKEMEIYKNNDQINEIIQKNNQGDQPEEKGADPSTSILKIKNVPLFSTVSYSEQKAYLETDFMKDFQKKMNEQLAVMTEQKQLRSTKTDDKNKRNELRSTLNSLTQQLIPTIQEDNLSKAKEQASHQQLLKALQHEQRMEEKKIEQHKVDEELMEKFRSTKTHQVVLDTIKEQVGENDAMSFSQYQPNLNSENPYLDGTLEVSYVNPLEGISSSQVDSSNVVPLTGIESSQLVPFQQDNEFGNADKQNSIEFEGSQKGSQHNDGIQKVYSQLFSDLGSKNSLSEQLDSQLQQEFQEKNMNLLQQLQNLSLDKSQDQKNVSKQVFQANKNLLEKLKVTNQDNSEFLENFLKKLKEERDELLFDVEENNKELEITKSFYFRNKDYRVNDFDAPLSLQTSLSPYELEKCMKYEIDKYLHDEDLKKLAKIKEEKNTLCKSQALEVEQIKAKWKQVQDTREQLNEKISLIEKVQKPVDMINSYILQQKEELFKFNSFQDLEKLKNCVITQRESFHGVSNIKIEEKDIRYLLNKIEVLNQNPVVQTRTSLGSTSKERIRNLIDQEYELKQAMSQSKIDEAALLEFKAKKAELQQEFEERKKKQDEFFMSKIEQLKENVEPLKLQDIPVAEMEVQREIKKQLDLKILELESWFEKKTRKSTW